jgi:hypothetical protein
MSNAEPPAQRRKLNTRKWFVVGESLRAEDHATALWHQDEVARLEDLSEGLKVRRMFPQISWRCPAGVADW